MLPFIVGLLVVAVIVGWHNLPCDNPDCIRIHALHVKADADQRRETLERDRHRYHSRDWPDETCAYCAGGGWER